MLRLVRTALVALFLLGGACDGEGCLIFDFDDCALDSDCRRGERCDHSGWFGTQCLRECLCDSECGRGEYCGYAWGLFSVLDTSSIHACREGCRGDMECGEGRICQRNKCREGCRLDAECGRGEICASHECRAGCRLDAECGRGEVCVLHECREGCREDGECAPGERCVYQGEGLSRCGEGCLSDESCEGEGERCVCGRCVTRCEESAECAEGELCPLALNSCEEVRCAPDPGVICGGARCRPFHANDLSAGGPYELAPCCYGAGEESCGVVFLGEGGCAVLEETPPGRCDCPDGGCCLPDGRCGASFSPEFLLWPRSWPSLCISQSSRASEEAEELCADD